MAREGKGRIKDRSSTEHPKVFVYVPTEVARDTAFPFDWKKGEELLVKIEGQKLIITKVDASRSHETKSQALVRRS